jgi:hypothetical protein
MDAGATGGAKLGAVTCGESLGVGSEVSGKLPLLQRDAPFVEANEVRLGLRAVWCEWPRFKLQPKPHPARGLRVARKRRAGPHVYLASPREDQSGVHGRIPAGELLPEAP